MRGIKYLIGIDEVGRGSLAGPVVVAAVLLPRNFQLPFTNYQLPKLRDSKKLTAHQRHEWFEYIKGHPKIHFAISKCFPSVIDKINISKAANLAATRAFERLTKNLKLKTSAKGGSASGGKNCLVFLDGGLYLNKLKTKNLKPKTRTVVRGDEKIPVIALASIVAKVTRDRLMRRLHKKYPRYGFINHVGYGTKKHIKVIRRFGRSPIHRKSFKIS